MLYVKKKLTEDLTVNVELTENDEYYTRCVGCGQEVKATEEIIDDFTGFLFGTAGIYCEKCTAKRPEQRSQ